MVIEDPIQSLHCVKNGTAPNNVGLASGMSIQQPTNHCCTSHWAQTLVKSAPLQTLGSLTILQSSDTLRDEEITPSDMCLNEYQHFFVTEKPHDLTVAQASFPSFQTSSSIVT